MIAIPIGLTLVRLLLGPLAIAFALTNQPHFVYAPLLLIGMLSDIFDGVLARRFGVSRPWLRRFDSATDIFYYLCVFITTCLVAGDVVLRAIIPLILLIVSEVTCLVVSFVRFGSLAAIHCYSAKVYGLAIFAAFFAVLGLGFGSWVFFVLAIVALIANAEAMIILLRSRTAPVDVLSIFHLKRERS
jgi:CDP-diacylglycerol--glycerol-3-phosphate 3-phosphatidyltransferase